MTEDAWELIEHRLWSKFSTKLWSIVGIFLTLSTLAGVFGVSAYIDQRVDKKVEGERKKLEEARQGFLTESGELVRKIRLVHYLSNDYIRDYTTYERVIRAARKEVTASYNGGLLTSTTKSQLDSILDKFESLNLSFFEYYTSVREINILLATEKAPPAAQGNISDDPLTKSDWEDLKENVEKIQIHALLVAIEMLPHLFALQASQQNIVYESLKKQLLKPVSRAELYQDYEQMISREYYTEIEKYALPFKIRNAGGPYAWYSLSPGAKEAFIQLQAKAKRELEN